MRSKRSNKQVFADVVARGRLLMATLTVSSSTRRSVIPSLARVVSSGKGVPGQSTALHLRGRRFAPTALRCSVSRPRRSTHCAHCVRSVQTIATSQFTSALARAATSPSLAGRAGRGRPAVRKAQAVPRTACVPAHLLGAAQARRGLPGHAFAVAFVLLHPREEPSRQAVPAGGDLWSDEDRRTGVGARSALRELTRRNCLSATNEVSEASSATRPLAENRSAAGAVRRPRNHEPPAGTAWRDAAAPRNCSITRPASEFDELVSGERDFMRDELRHTQRSK
jgi:hypothetical protein